jgi:hypothetical protein
MAVVTGYNELGNPQIDSGGGIPGQKDRENAIKLDIQLKEGVPKIENGLIAEGLLAEDLNSKQFGDAETWWELGSRIADIIDGNDLIKLSDWILIWKAIELHGTVRIKKAERGKKRNHLRNCYKLSKLPKDKVLDVNWSEWSYLLDSPSLNNDRADQWLQRNIKKITKLKRDPFRKMVQFFNNDVCKKGKIEFGIFSDEEFKELWDNKLDNFLKTLNEEP